MDTNIEAVYFRNTKEVLEYLLDQITWCPEHTLFAHGAHTTSSKTKPLTTDFDFHYNCTRHIYPHETWVVVPGYNSGSEETLIEASVLHSVIERFDGHKKPDRQFAFSPTDNIYPALAHWASHEHPTHQSSSYESFRSYDRSSTNRKGISITRQFESYPTTQQIEAVAQKVGYCGNVTSSVFHEGGETALISIGGRFTPASERCLHVRVVWRFSDYPPFQSPVEPVDEDSEANERVPAWETVLRQAMLGKRTGAVRDADYENPADKIADGWVDVENDLGSGWDYPLWGVDEVHDADSK